MTPWTCLTTSAYQEFTPANLRIDLVAPLQELEGKTRMPPDQLGKPRVVCHSPPTPLCHACFSKQDRLTNH